MTHKASKARLSALDIQVIAGVAIDNAIVDDRRSKESTADTKQFDHPEVYSLAY